MGELANRRNQTTLRIAELQKKLTQSESVAKGKACVYATGSFGRGEASSYSDLDLFILGKSTSIRSRKDAGKSRLKRLDDIRIKAELIGATRALGIPEFDGDGRYLVHYSVYDFTKTLGTPEDDVTNTFTARLLLLLESTPLLEKAVYFEVIKEVIAAYWRDFDDHKSNFMPAFLANDILRLWRTFCVNYEARTERVPQREKAKGKIKNYKLKHSRLLTCYSALLYLLAIYRQEKTVTPAHALKMVTLSPTQRIEWLQQEKRFSSAWPTLRRLQVQYEKFLSATNFPEEDLIKRFLNRNEGRKAMEAAYKFGDLMFEALDEIGSNNRFYRLLVV